MRSSGSQTLYQISNKDAGASSFTFRLIPYINVELITYFSRSDYYLQKFLEEAATRHPSQVMMAKTTRVCPPVGEGTTSNSENGGNGGHISLCSRPVRGSVGRVGIHCNNCLLLHLCAAFTQLLPLLLTPTSSRSCTVISRLNFVDGRNCTRY